RTHNQQQPTPTTKGKKLTVAGVNNKTQKNKRNYTTQQTNHTKMQSNGLLCDARVHYTVLTQHPNQPTNNKANAHTAY
ncbi:hypothetical protein, partial [Corynebacterium phoceense]|uniref:hypothetical protein n=1 Tax=Corynebacterium phoceense TaxID=1686286 RepID=UPI00211C65CD